MKLHMTLGLLVLVLGAWFSSGTLAPYAVTLHPKQMEFSQNHAYPLNTDHKHFEQVDLMVGGYPQKNWETSHYLRRVLYSLLARPFTALFGFLYGGVLFNLILTMATYFIFAKYLLREYSKRTQIAGIWLFATYPGIAYWVGLPYHHASIVPLCVLQYLLLKNYLESPSVNLGKSLKLYLYIGICGLAYDLIPIFGFAALLATLIKRRAKHILPGLLMLIAPTLLVILGINQFVDASNNNSNIFGSIVRSYLQPALLKEWMRLLPELPKILFWNFFDSNFWALPGLFLISLVLAIKPRKSFFKTPEGLILIALSCIFLFNNLAPSYEGWQMRGVWIARIYQPLFISMFVVILKTFDSISSHTLRGKLLSTSLVMVILLQGWNVFGGILGQDRWPNWTYYRFYQHTDQPHYHSNLESLGRKPLLTKGVSGE